MTSAGPGRPFSTPNATSSAALEQLSSVQQYADYSSSPQQWIRRAPQQPVSPEYTYDSSQVYNNSPELIHSPQQSVCQPSHQWTTPTPIQSPYWLMNAYAQAPPSTAPSPAGLGTCPAADSSSWISECQQPHSSSTFGSDLETVPSMGRWGWDTDTSSSQSSSARLQPFIEKLYNLLLSRIPHL